MNPSRELIRSFGCVELKHSFGHGLSSVIAAF